MKKIIIIALLVCPYISFAQDFRKQESPKLNLELSGGYPFASFGTSLDFRSNSALKVYQLSSLIDSSKSQNQWIGMTKRISIDRQSHIHLGLGLFTQFSHNLFFDIAPSLQYERYVIENLSLTASYMHVFPDRWKDQNIHSLQFGLKYGIPATGRNNGIAKYQRSKNRNTLTTFAFGSHYTMGGISYYFKDDFGIDLRGYTDLGYLFNVAQSMDMQCVSAVYSTDVSNDISFDTYFGASLSLQANTKFHSLHLSERMRVRLYENLWFSIELTQHSRVLIKNRIQPLVHSGFVIEI